MPKIHPASPGVSKDESAVEVWALNEIVTRLRRVLRASVRSDYPWEQLPMAQIEILQRLAEEPGLRISELATRHRLAINTVGNVIQQMVVAGLVTRQTDPRDRRAVTVQLTDSGRAQLAGWLAVNGRRLDAAMSELSAADRRVIAGSLPSLTRLVETLEHLDRSEQPPTQA